MEPFKFKDELDVVEELRWTSIKPLCFLYCLLFVGSCWKMDYRVLHLQALETRGKTFLRHWITTIFCCDCIFGGRGFIKLVLRFYIWTECILDFCFVSKNELFGPCHGWSLCFPSLHITVLACLLWCDFICMTISGLWSLL